MIARLHVICRLHRNDHCLWGKAGRNKEVVPGLALDNTSKAPNDEKLPRLLETSTV